MDAAQLCSQCGWAFDTEALRANACKKCKAAILLTSIAYLEKFEKPAVQKYIARYTQAIKMDPQDAEALLAMGLCYIQLGLFDLADKFLQRLVDADPASASGYYYRSICVFRGTRPRCASLGTVRSAERLLIMAMELDPVNGRTDCLLASIRHDYYVFNGMRVPHPGPEELQESAREKHLDQLELDRALQLLGMRENPLLSRGNPPSKAVG